MKHLTFAKNSVKLLLRMLGVKFRVMDIRTNVVEDDHQAH